MASPPTARDRSTSHPQRYRNKMGRVLSNCSIQIALYAVPPKAPIAERIYAHHNAIQAFVLSTYDASTRSALALVSTTN
jgi:hypothetical protein